MISEEVIDAVKNGEFYIYGINNIKEGIEILTEMPYGNRDKKGRFEIGTDELDKIHEYIKVNSELLS